MAHPDHDQFIGRLAGARLRGTADRRAVSGAAAEAHPDAETWAAYVDGGLQADEVVGLETHLAGCPACRHLVAALVPEVSSGAASGVREVEAPAAERGVVIPNLLDLEQTGHQKHGIRQVNDCQFRSCA